MRFITNLILELAEGVEKARRGASWPPATPNPAADLLELEGGALVPVVFVVEQGDGRVVIDPPAGLFDT